MTADAPQRFVFSLKNILLLLLCLAPPLSAIGGKGSMEFMFFGMWIVFATLLYSPLSRMRKRHCLGDRARVNGTKVALVVVAAITGCLFGVMNELVFKFSEWYAYGYDIALDFSVVSPPYHILFGLIVGGLTGLVAVIWPVRRSDQ